MTLIALATVTYVAVNARDGLIGSIAHLARTRAYPFILMGLIVVLVFSRTFGSGNLLWEEVLAAHYTIQFKSALQEGLELFGYLLILHGSIALLVDASPPETAASRHESQPTDAG